MRMIKDRPYPEQLIDSVGIQLRCNLTLRSASC